jgi:hypothetical protein
MCRTGVVAPTALVMAQGRRGARGSSVIVEAIENWQTHPALASGIITSPLAGMALIQQPSRCPAK